MRSVFRSAITVLAAGACALHAQDPAFQRRDAGLPPLGDRVLDTLPAQAGGSVRAAGSGETEAGTSAYGDQEVLVRNKPWEIFSVNASASYTSQSNAALSPLVNEEAEVFSQSVSVAATVPFSQITSAPWLSNTFISLNVAEQTLRYRGLDFLDFDRVDTSATLLQILPGNFVATVGSRYYRLSVPSDFDSELFANFSVTGGLSRSFTPSRNSTLFIGANADVSLSSSSELAQRNEYGLSALYSLKLAPRWEARVSAGVTLLDFDQHDDVLYTASFGLDYVPREWFRIGASIAYSRSESNLDSFDYENFTFGPSLRASIRF